MLKKFIWIIAILGAGALVAFTLYNNKQEMAATIAEAGIKNTAVSVVAANVKIENLSRDFTATGHFAPIEEITLSSENTGRVEKIFVAEGDKVRRGDQIARLSSEKIVADKHAAEASLVKAKKDLERYQQLEPKGGVTRQQLDEVTLAYENALARVQTINKTLSESTIRASMDGIINKRYIEEGSYLNPGGSVADIVNVNSMKMVVQVSEGEVIQLHTGQQVTVWANVLPEEKLTGKISFISVKADNALRYAVEIQFANSPEVKLRSGMFGTAEFKITGTKEALTIPRRAISGSLKDPSVYVIRDSIAELKHVRVGTVTQSQVEILDGLELDDVVVVDGQINLSDGENVEVTSRN